MDKRTLIAFLLIGALLVLTQTTWYKKSVLGIKELPQKQVSMQDSTATQKEENVASQKSEDRAIASPQIEEEQPTEKIQQDRKESLSSFDSLSTVSTGREIYINTDKYEALLNTKGATVKSWKLKNYFYDENVPVQLIKKNGYGNLGIQFAVDQDTIKTQNFEFDVDKRTIDLTSGRTEDVLVFSLKLDNNRTLKKIFTFYKDKYIFDLRIELTNLGEIIDDQKYTLTWLSGLEYTEKNIDEDIRNSKSYIYTGGGKEELKLPEKPNVKESTNEIEGKIDWVAIRTKYFASIIFPDTEDDISARLSGATESFGDEK
ncbi:membrane protein insertase YidC, partial [candidate division KSB1 bacterium]|nr:membrane protein insertase YidC [candidate division KSB1 bacterium]